VSLLVYLFYSVEFPDFFLRVFFAASFFITFHLLAQLRAYLWDSASSTPITIKMPAFPQLMYLPIPVLCVILLQMVPAKIEISEKIS
jgi:hypothetical protein